MIVTSNWSKSYLGLSWDIFSNTFIAIQQQLSSMIYLWRTLLDWLWLKYFLRRLSFDVINWLFKLNWQYNNSENFYSEKCMTSEDMMVNKKMMWIEWWHGWLQLLDNLAWWAWTNLKTWLWRVDWMKMNLHEEHWYKNDDVCDIMWQICVLTTSWVVYMFS